LTVSPPQLFDRGGDRPHEVGAYDSRHFAELKDRNLSTDAVAVNGKTVIWDTVKSHAVAVTENETMLCHMTDAAVPLLYKLQRPSARLTDSRAKSIP